MSVPANTAASTYGPGLEPILPQGMIPLAPLGADRTPPKRLDDPIKARAIVVNLWQASQERRLKEAAIQGQIDGNPPYNPLALRKAGRAGDANFNSLEAKALCSTSMVPYYDLFSGGNRYVDIKLDLGDDWQSQYASGAVSEEYDALLRRWSNFEFVMFGMMRDYVTFGKGYLVWRKNGSWRAQKIAHYRVFVPDATPVDLDELELFVVFQNWPVTFMMDAVRDKAAATAAGWDVEEARKAMMAAVPVDPSVPNDPMTAQAQLRDSDIYVAARNSTVQLATIYVKEFDGRWSELIVRRDQVPSMSQSIGMMDQAGFIFKRFGYYDSVHECLCPFFLEPADANWNGTSGLGRDIFAFCQLKDRIGCAQADAVFLRNSIILQPQQETDRQKLTMMQLGKLTILPPGVQAQPATLLGDIASTIEVSRELSTQIERNTGIYRPTLEKGGGNPDTLGQFQTEFTQATMLSNSSVSRFYSQCDRFYEQQWKRVLEGAGTMPDDPDALDALADADKRDDYRSEAKRFVARCTRRGVPLPLLKRLLHIRAYRAIGQGSASMRQQVVSTFLAPTIFPYFPPDGQQNILEDFTRVLGGQTAVNRYLPASARLQLPTDQQWQALQENAALKIGAPVTWTPAQNNIIHAQTHLTAAAQAASSVQQGADPHDVLSFIDHVGPHIQEHLQRESSKPASKPAVKALSEQWKRLASVADQLRQHIQATAQQQQDLQQRQQQTLTEQQIDMQKMQGQLAISQHKAEATLQLKAQRQSAELALKQQQLEGQHALTDASTAAGIHQSTAKTQADIIHKQAKTAADIEATRTKAEAAAEAARARPAGGE